MCFPCHWCVGSRLGVPVEMSGQKRGMLFIRWPKQLIWIWSFPWGCAWQLELSVKSFPLQFSLSSIVGFAFYCNLALSKVTFSACDKRFNAKWFWLSIDYFDRNIFTLLNAVHCFACQLHLVVTQENDVISSLLFLKSICAFPLVTGVEA